MGKLVRIRYGGCKESDCAASHYARGWCKTHWQQARRRGAFIVHPEWRRQPHTVRRALVGSGQSLTSGGYRKIRIERDDKIEWILEHRYIMEQHLGRRLLSKESVHHKRPKDKLNNDISNLELWSSSQPTGGRVSDLVAWAEEILSLYRPEAKEAA